jgi:hypothetical protein
VDFEDAELRRDLADVARSARAELREAQELAEDASEHLTRKESDLVDVVLAAMHRGQSVRARVGAWQFSGTVVHVADDLAVIEEPASAQVDLRLSALSELWLLDAVAGAGRARRSSVPASFEDCLEGLEATGRAVELGGADLEPSGCRVVVAALDHLVVEGRAAQRKIGRAHV